MINKKQGSINVPLFERIVNFSFDTFDNIKETIDSIEGYKEKEKSLVLVNDFFYRNFFVQFLKITENQLIRLFLDYYNDDIFHKEFEKKLNTLDELDDGNAGDVRFNSILLYIIIRIRKPKVFIETGVANGKSSAMILLAMSHNGFGKLISIDLPNKKGDLLLDGAMTHTFGLDVGWLVPDYLKFNWDLRLGDSLMLLDEICNSDLSGVEGFFHDSLHTYNHAKSEFNKVLSKLDKNSILICDDIDMECGLAFHDILKEKDLVGYAFREIGAVCI